MAKNADGETYQNLPGFKRFQPAPKDTTPTSSAAPSKIKPSHRTTSQSTAATSGSREGGNAPAKKTTPIQKPVTQPSKPATDKPTRTSTTKRKHDDAISDDDFIDVDEDEIVPKPKPSMSTLRKPAGKRRMVEVSDDDVELEMSKDPEEKRLGEWYCQRMKKNEH